MQAAFLIYSVLIAFIFIVRLYVMLTVSVLEVNTLYLKLIYVSSSFGYLITDSIVAPHDKMDVSRQLRN